MKYPARLLLLSALALVSWGCSQSLNQADVTDSALRARVRSELKAQKGLDLRYVDVDVHSRVVTVSGLVHSWQEKHTIERIVRGIWGVDQAVINLAIQE